MKTYLGNYLGLVVDDRDPENRGRVKVFIPHVMPTLYSGWNKEGKDITFNITDSGLPTGLDTEIVDRLQRILPWAECAAPIFGAGPAGKYNYGDGTLNPLIQNRGNGNFDNLTKQGTGLETGLTGTRASTAVQNGLIGGIGLCARGTNNILSNYVFGADWATVNNGDISSGADAKNFGPILQSRYNMSVVPDTGVYQNGDTRVMTKNGSPNAAGHIETYMNGVWYSDHKQSSSYNGRGYTSTGLYRLPTAGLTSGADTASSAGSDVIGGVPDANPSVDEAAAVDANTQTDPYDEQGGITDSGTQIVGYDENGKPLEENLPTGTDGATGESLSTRFTAYSPQALGSSSISLEGGYASSRPGLDGQSVVRTLQDVASGDSKYVTLAGDPSTYGQQYVIPSITFTNKNGQSQTLTNVVGVVHDTGSAFRGAGTSKFDIAVDKDLSASQLNTQSFLRDNGAITLTATDNAAGVETTVAAVSQQPINPAPNPNPTIFGPNTNYMPTGMFGSARAGQTVWVFFQEGDPMFPVYFAAAYGSNEWSNINQASSPDPIKNSQDSYQGVNTNLSLDAGGIASRQIISGQTSGFEKDEFAFQVYGKNGSALTFTFLATLLNSKYDFRQHTQGDGHYITGGNRVDRTTGDHAYICEQDLIFTIGNWSQEAQDAAKEIQDVINEAMRAAKDTYES